MRKMRVLRWGRSGVVLVGLAVAAWGQGGAPERVTVKLTDPSRPGMVRVNVVNGSLTVKGYEGKEVLVETDERGVKVQESDNEVIVLPSALSRAELRILVPVKTSLQLKCASGGNILVEKVEGEIEATGINASVTLRAVAGVAVAHSLQGRVRVQMDRVTPGKGMSFSALNGDVEVTLPQDTKAEVKLQTSNGSIHSDFSVSSREDSSPKSGKRLVGAINGGGPEIQLKAVNGGVYLRKSERRGVDR